jgi:hypothetical protein
LASHLHVKDAKSLREIHEVLLELAEKEPGGLRIRSAGRLWPAERQQAQKIKGPHSATKLNS